MSGSDPYVSISDFSPGVSDGRVPLSDRWELRLIAIGATRLNEKWSFSSIKRPYFRLYSNAQDGAAIRIGTSWIPLEAKRLYLIPAWLSFGTRSSARVQHAYVHFDVPGWPSSAIRAVLPSVFASKASDALADDVFSIACRIAAGEPPSDDMLFAVKSAAYATLGMAIAGRAKTSGAVNRRLARVLAYIETHLGATLDGPRLARRAALAPDVLIRHFRRALGVTPARYVAERRVCRAAELLAGTELSIEHIAESCGFPNRFHFTRVFTRHMGLPPARYRKQRAG
ncbi:MAG TPA: AraC family transcriptional regulator [Polyangiaceae bacterium]|nr:AraC family transcriptional regulator [Polyangiaceae bacterium]